MAKLMLDRPSLNARCPFYTCRSITGPQFIVQMLDFAQKTTTQSKQDPEAELRTFVSVGKIIKICSTPSKPWSYSHS